MTKILMPVIEKGRGRKRPVKERDPGPGHRRKDEVVRKDIRRERSTQENRRPAGEENPRLKGRTETGRKGMQPTDITKTTGGRTERRQDRGRNFLNKAGSWEPVTAPLASSYSTKGRGLLTASALLPSNFRGFRGQQHRTQFRAPYVRLMHAADPRCIWAPAWVWEVSSGRIEFGIIWKPQFPAP